ncbi:MAG: DUF5320 domain-containing protein [Deltaproteobacteria bacterium]|nr:DUF5320 domain-containing protein [Deltaproteobacteria bacterium]
MPGFNRTGPMGQGSRTGGGFRRCDGANKARRRDIGRRAGMNRDNDTAFGRCAGKGRLTGQRGRRSRGRVQESS